MARTYDRGATTRISLLRDSRCQVLLFTSRAGDYFGDLGLLKDQPRGATVTSYNGMVCLITNKEGFNNMLTLGGATLQKRVSACRNLCASHDTFPPHASQTSAVKDQPASGQANEPIHSENRPVRRPE
jgi:hypothetical protein